MFGKSLLRLACLAALPWLAPVPAMADPFPWEGADITGGTVRFPDGRAVAYRVGTVDAGRLEIAVILLWQGSAGRLRRQQVIHEMADAAPAVVLRDGVLAIRTHAHPQGAENVLETERCWRPAAAFDRFVTVACPPGG
jgi:hypothetical protein